MASFDDAVPGERAKFRTALFGLEMGWGLDKAVGLEEMLVGRICQDNVTVIAFRNTIPVLSVRRSTGFLLLDLFSLRFFFFKKSFILTLEHPQPC